VVFESFVERLLAHHPPLLSPATQFIKSVKDLEMGEDAKIMNSIG
jgi:hypothetical protein